MGNMDEEKNLNYYQPCGNNIKGPIHLNIKVEAFQSSFIAFFELTWFD